MTNFFRSAWTEVLSPLFRRPPALQLAALCWRATKTGREVLLVTSSEGRWILPKGWPIDGLTAPEAALQEAWEEAGVVKGRADWAPLGTIPCRKQFSSGAEVDCHIKVFAVEALEMSKKYPECDQRKRRWATPAKAAELVDDAGLRGLLATL